MLAASLVGAMCVAGCNGNTQEVNIEVPEELNQEVLEDLADSTVEAIEGSEEGDQAKADEVAELIDAIYVQTRTDETDAQCVAAKEAWDALTDAQKE